MLSATRRPRRPRRRRSSSRTRGRLLLASLDSGAALSAERKKQVRELQEGLAALAKERVGILKVRAQESEALKQAKADLEQGILAVRNAITLLRRYYGSSGQDESEALLQQALGEGQPARPAPHEPAEGAGGAILAALEVVMSDMAGSLAAVETENSNAREAYEKRIQEIDVSTALKGKDVVYNTQEFRAADADVDRLSEARGAGEQELSAVLEYYKKVRERCVGKAPSYEQRASRRTAEMDGLREALDALEEAAGAPAPEFVQVRSRHRHSLRGDAIAQGG
ncbi:unnamed protein product [Prorocentrum cordatum]|uniref:Uncharacterized protein n=1 Tax=Prorocentrum cordatum TaxID=2364126 RepID=A0ABN9R243_9DINO|nr:unnamed protein product [Polarella glacialis]